jgi:zinc protease
MKIYKYIICLALAFISILGNANAQSQKTVTFEVEGLKVILRPTPKEVISARLFVKGGTANYTKDKEGIEELAFDVAMNCGTTKLNKDAFSTAAEKIGTTFGSSTSLDFGEMNVTCLKTYWDQSWTLFSDAIMTPSFDEKEFSLVKEQLITGAKQTEGDPDSYLEQLAMEGTFQNRNYAKQTGGTVASLEKLNLDETKKYFSSVVGKKRCFLVVVGNISQEDLTAKVKASLAKLPAGNAAPTESKMLITQPSENIVDRDIATNYLMGIMSAPSMNSSEGIPMLIGMNILYDRFFVELRTKRSLSYAPSASYNRAAISSPYNQLYITTQKPKESMQVMIQILDSIKLNGFSEKELRDAKQGFLTSTYMKMETSAAQSFALGRAEVVGSYSLDDKFSDQVDAVNLSQVNKVFNDYTKSIKWSYLGKKDEVKKEDFKQTMQIKVPSKN